MCTLSMGRYVHVYVAYGEICTRVHTTCTYLPILNIHMYIPPHTQQMLGMGRYVHVYVEYGEVCTCVCWVWGGMYMWTVCIDG